MKTEFFASQAAVAACANPLDIGVRIFERYHVFSEVTSRGPVAWMAASQREFYILQGVVSRLMGRTYYGYVVEDGEVFHQFGKGGETFDPQFVGFFDGAYYYLQESGEYTALKNVPRDFYEG